MDVWLGRMITARISAVSLQSSKVKRLLIVSTNDHLQLLSTEHSDPLQRNDVSEARQKRSALARTLHVQLEVRVLVDVSQQVVSSHSNLRTVGNQLDARLHRIKGLFSIDLCEFVCS